MLTIRIVVFPLHWCAIPDSWEGRFWLLELFCFLDTACAILNVDYWSGFVPFACARLERGGFDHSNSSVHVTCAMLGKGRRCWPFRACSFFVWAVRNTKRFVLFLLFAMVRVGSIRMMQKELWCNVRSAKECGTFQIWMENEIHGVFFLALLKNFPIQKQGCFNLQVDCRPLCPGTDHTPNTRWAHTPTRGSCKLFRSIPARDEMLRHENL